MVTFDDVARIALALPETEETTSYGNVSWAVKSGGKTKGKGFVWERPLSKKDRKLLTEAGEIEVPPDEVILAARVEDLAEKEAVLAEHVDATFTTPHFNGYPAVLVRLDRVDERAAGGDRHLGLVGGGAGRSLARRSFDPESRDRRPAPTSDDSEPTGPWSPDSDVVVGGRRPFFTLVNFLYSSTTVSGSSLASSACPCRARWPRCTSP